MNELYWFLLLVLNFGAILLIYRKMGKTGLFVWIPIATILANIQVVKFVELFGITATLGNILYASSFLATDILSENHGKKDAKTAVFIGFFSMIIMTLVMNLAIYFIPSEADSAHVHLEGIFKLMPRIALGSLAAYLLSQLHDIKAYAFWKEKLPSVKHIWIRNNASTMVSQLLDTAVFTLIAFGGTVPGPVFMEIFITTYLFKFAVAALDTPMVYLASSWKGKLTK